MEYNRYSLWESAYDEYNQRLAESQAEEYFAEQAAKYNRIGDLVAAYFEQFAGDDWQDFQPPIPF